MVQILVSHPHTPSIRWRTGPAGFVLDLQQNAREHPWERERQEQQANRARALPFEELHWHSDPLVIVRAGGSERPPAR